jgi:hypothetical protein
MKLGACLIGLTAIGWVVSGAAQAADVSRLEWGAFVVESDSSNGLADWKASSSDDGRTVALKFKSFEAKAEGALIVSNAYLAGHFDVAQPPRDGFTQLRVALDGYAIKGENAIARVVLKIGAADRMIEWPRGTAVSERFSKTIDIFSGDTDRLPDPFAISARATVQKETREESAYLSLDAIIVTADNPKVAGR